MWLYTQAKSRASSCYCSLSACRQPRWLQSPWEVFPGFAAGYIEMAEQWSIWATYQSQWPFYQHGALAVYDVTSGEWYHNMTSCDVTKKIKKESQRPSLSYRSITRYRRLHDIYKQTETTNLTRKTTNYWTIFQWNDYDLWTNQFIEFNKNGLNGKLLSGKTAEELHAIKCGWLN